MAVASNWRKDMNLILVNRLGRNTIVMLTDHLDMTIDVDWDVKPQFNKPTKPEMLFFFSLVFFYVFFFFFFFFQI